MPDDSRGARPTAPYPHGLDTGLLADIEHAADLALLAPSVHNTQPWLLVLHPDRIDLRADPARRLTVIDPQGRELMASVGAALLNARVALAACDRSVTVERLPSPQDPDLAAVLRPGAGPPDADLAALAAAVQRRRTNRRRFTTEPVPDDLIRRLSRAAAAEDTVLVPVLHEAERRLVARMTQLADAEQNADPAYRAELRRWTNRDEAAGDGVPAAAVPHVDGSSRDDVPIRDFDTAGRGGLPADTSSSADQTLVLLSSHADDPLAWLRAGEALERVLLVLTAEGWAASPLTQALEVGRTRAQLRAELSWDTHPQVLLRIGRAQPGTGSPRRPRDQVVAGSSRSSTPPSAVGPGHQVRPDPVESGTAHPVPDGRGGTTWL